MSHIAAGPAPQFYRILSPCFVGSMSSSVLNAARMSPTSSSAGVSLMGWGGFVTGLVAVHLVALLAWIALLISNEIKGSKGAKKD